jgi:hypothetical protein
MTSGWEQPFTCFYFFHVLFHHRIHLGCALGTVGPSILLASPGALASSVFVMFCTINSHVFSQLADYPPGKGHSQPEVITYEGERLISWDSGMSLSGVTVLRESGQQGTKV